MKIILEIEEKFKPFFITVLLLPSFLTGNADLFGVFLYNIIFFYLLWVFFLFAVYNFHFIKKKKPSALFIIFLIWNLWMALEQLRCPWLDWHDYCNLIRGLLIVTVIETYVKDDSESLFKGCMFIFEFLLYFDLISVLHNISIGRPKEHTFLGYYNNVIVFLFPAICVAAMYIKYKKKKIRPLLLILVSIVLAFLSSAGTPRGSMIAFLSLFLFEIIILKIFKRVSIWPWAILALLFNFFVLFVYKEGMFPAMDSFIVDILHRSTDFTGRTFIWNEYIRMAKEAVIIGYGDTPILHVDANLSFPHAHNFYLNQIVEFGIIGLILYFVFSWFYINQIDKRENDIYKVLFISLVFGIFLSFITDYLTRWYLYCFVFFTAYNESKQN